MWKFSNSTQFDDEFPFFNLVTTAPLGNMRDSVLRDKYILELGLNFKNIITAQQVHGNKIAVVNEKCNGEVLGVDGLFTNVSSIALCIFTADCMPIILGSKDKKAVGVIHAGWRGLADGILENGINKFCLEYNTEPKNIFVSIGPCIGKCCFEVGAEVARSFNLKEEKINIDLTAIACKKLADLGVKQVNQSRSCTKHDTSLFFSYRRNKTTQRIMTIVAIK